MMLKLSVDTLLDKMPSKYSLCILQAKRTHKFEAGTKPTQKSKSVKVTLQALEEIESGNVVIHPDPEAKHTAVLARVEAKRLAKEGEERKIKEQVAKEKEEGEKI